MNAREEEIALLELVLEQLERRDDTEAGREQIANNKLTSLLTVAPIVVTLSTTAFFSFISFVKEVGSWAILLMSLFCLTLLCFIGSTIFALIGLWPQRSQYSVMGLKTINSIDLLTTRATKLRKIISECTECVRNNGRVNSSKFGYYAFGVRCLVGGLAIMAILVFASVALVSLGAASKGAARTTSGVSHQTVRAAQCL